MKYLLIVFLLLLFGPSGSLLAGEWKSNSHVDAKVVLDTDWPWAAAHEGQYWETWTDDYMVRLYLAGWWDGAFPRVEIVLYRPAPQTFWKYVPKLNKKSLLEWAQLAEKGITEIKKMPCEVHKCVTFKTGSHPCLAFTDVKGSTGKLTVGDDDTDVVTGYYCKSSSEPVTAQQLNNFLLSIIVRK